MSEPHATPTPAAFATIEADLDALTAWEDKYRYIIDLGRTLSPLNAQDKQNAEKVQGCVSQVWLLMEPNENAPDKIFFRGDSDAHIVRGLIAMLVALFSGQNKRDILALDATMLFAGIGLDSHLSPQRSNGLVAMTNHIRAEAAKP